VIAIAPRPRLSPSCALARARHWSRDPHGVGQARQQNLARLIQALPAVLERWPDATLVLPGNPTPHERELQSLAGELGIAERVAFPAYVDAPIWRACTRWRVASSLPPINEGFGLPILEAMRRGTPVACARASALPEVAGEAALYLRSQQRARHRHGAERVARRSPAR
jgi:glycosyltransferase involved in cell wall biosynthesis